jgi:hypothetical protein
MEDNAYVRPIVRGTFVPTSEPALMEHVMASMSAAPPHIGIGAAEEAWGSNRELREGLQEVTAPKTASNNSSFVTTDDGFSITSIHLCWRVKGTMASDLCCRAAGP